MSNTLAKFSYGEKHVDLVIASGNSLTPGLQHLLRQVRTSYKMNWGGFEENDSLIWNELVDASPSTTHFVSKIYDRENGLTKIVCLTKREVELTSPQLPGDIHWWEVAHQKKILPYEEVLAQSLSTQKVSVFTRLAAYTPYTLKRPERPDDIKRTTENDTLIGVATMLQSGLKPEETTLWTIGPLLRDKVLTFSHNGKNIALGLDESMRTLGLENSHSIRLKNNQETLCLRTIYPGYWNELESLRNFIVRLVQEKLVKFDELPIIFFNGLDDSTDVDEITNVLQKLHYYDMQHLSPLLQGKIRLQSGYTTKELQARLFAEVKPGPVSVISRGSDCIHNAATILQLAAEKFNTLQY